MIPKIHIFENTTISTEQHHIHSSVRSTRGAQRRDRETKRMHSSGGRIYLASFTCQCQPRKNAKCTCAAHCCAAYSLSIGATASLRAASVTCVDCCFASARPTMPPPVWLQPFCSPSSLLLCGRLSVGSAPHHAIRLLRLG